MPSRITPPIRAAIYARMSTEHQQYSIDNQVDAIRKYASNNNMEIVRIFKDEGKSGLTLRGRPAMKELLDVVKSGAADFSVILVYDVSRWGRFQNPEEGGYYEFICFKAGIGVIYCAEDFKNDGTMASALQKILKRYIAGNQSDILSMKVFDGQCRLIRFGYRQGGHAGFGLRRMLIDQNGTPKGVLNYGEMKSIQTDRVILIPGPDEEVKTVRWMYDQFVNHGKHEREIADMLNAQGVKTDLGRSWNNSTVRQILINEKYVGNNVFNRISFKLKEKRVKNPIEEWVRADGVFEAIVDPEIFVKVQEIFTERAKKYTNDEMLDMLKALYKKKGWLSSIIIDECVDIPSSAVYRNRFGGLLRAYKLVGYVPDIDYSYLEINQRIRDMYPQVVEEVITKLREHGGTVEYDESTGLIEVNGEFTALIVISRCQFTGAGAMRWNIRLNPTLSPDVTIAVRLDYLNKAPHDYYLLPSLDITVDKLRLAEHNGIYLDVYRFDNLDFFYSLARRVKIGVA